MSLDRSKTSIDTQNSSMDFSFKDTIFFVMAWKFKQVEAGGRLWEAAVHNFNIQLFRKHIPAHPELHKFPKYVWRGYHRREERQKPKG